MKQILFLISLIICLSFSFGVAQAAMLDLTTLGSSDTANGGLFYQNIASESAGSGIFSTFVRLKPKGNDTQERGYNTDGALEFETAGGAHTRSLLLGNIPIVDVGGVLYREFLLDLNEGKNKKSLISLDALNIHLENTGNLSGYPGSFSSSIYTLGANWIKLDGGLGKPGGGRSDIAAYIPSSLFGSDATKFVYLYSSFGQNTDPSAPGDDLGFDAGFEEWGVDSSGGLSPIVPEPASFFLIGSALLGLAGVSRRKNS